MTCGKLRILSFMAGAAMILAVGQARAGTMTSAISLGALGNPSFTASVSLGSGSDIVLGNNAIAGNYKEHIVFVNTNIGFSASNQTSTLSSSGTSFSTNTSSGSANLTYDTVAPGNPETLNSFSSNLSGSQVSNLSIGATAINMSTSLGTLALTPSFSGTVSGVSFTSSAAASAANNSALIPGTFTVLLNGSVTGSLNVLGITTVNVGTLFTFPTNTAVSFSGDLPANIFTQDNGVPFNGFELSQLRQDGMLTQISAALGSLQIPFSFSEALATSENFSVSSGSSGVTSINIQNTTLNANIVLSNLSFGLQGTTPSVLVPEPSTLVLGGMGLVGLIGLALKRRKKA